MKQKDFALIGVVVIFSAVFGFIVSNWLFSKPQNREQTAEVVDVITPEFPELPPKYYNSNSINPTQLIQIGNANNPNPFNTKP